MTSDPPITTEAELTPVADEASDAAEQMLAATEKLRARLPMMQGGAPGAAEDGAAPVPAQPTGA